MDCVAKCYEALSVYMKSKEAMGFDPLKIRDDELTEMRQIAKLAKEMKAAQLLCLGASVAAERIGDTKRNIYKLEKRWRKRMSKMKKMDTATA
jgi:hypothetical protein